MFLDIEPFSKKERPVKEREFSNWVKVANTIYDTEDEKLILQILQLELLSMRRDYVIKRLYSRFSALRAKREKANLKMFFIDVNPVWGTKEELKNMFRNWETMRWYLNSRPMTPELIKSLIYHEYKNGKRPYMMKRLYGKFSMLRMQHEKREMREWKLKSK